MPISVDEGVMSFFLGLAIWGYKGWLGELFPAQTPASEFLPCYSQRFSCVEGNTTFYATPSVATVQRWAAQVPAGFQFCPKLPKAITHHGPLLPHLRSGLEFLALMQHWGAHLGPLFVQLPPRYGPAQLPDLNQFLQGWTAATDWPLAVEVRHPDWFGAPHWTRFNPVLEDLQVQWLDQGTAVYFFVHCPIEAHSPTNARYLQAMLEQAGLPVPPLPWNQLELPPAQMTLFGN
jgi:uncharacterized protein YecE (DUF72 family)